MRAPARFRVAELAQVAFDDLRRAGVKVLLLDLDNTLCDPRGDAVPEESVAFCTRMRAAGLRGHVLSNAPRRRAERLADQLGLPCTAPARKPLRGAYRRVLRELGLPPAAVAAVGDQFLTDGLGAIGMGLSLVLVEPRYPRDKPLVRLARPVDRLLRRLVPQG